MAKVAILLLVEFLESSVEPSANAGLYSLIVGYGVVHHASNAISQVVVQMRTCEVPKQFSIKYVGQHVWLIAGVVGLLSGASIVGLLAVSGGVTIQVAA